MLRPKISVFIATSLDGYIAKEDGSIDWLNSFNETVPSGEDCGYKHFISTVDTLIMGRKSFEKVCEFDTWPYNLPVIVLSKQPNYLIPESLKTKATVTSENPKELIQRLTTEKIKHIYLDGGKTIQSFIKENLVDELTITLIPILLGGGCSLFGSLDNPVHLEQIECHSYDFGCVQIKYKVN
ncbi:MAG: dihydrofolate reductase [Legionella sp.]|nr:MAG: dihydrofolate reductase [Legionella sp.]